MPLFKLSHAEMTLASASLSLLLSSSSSKEFYVVVNSTSASLSDLSFRRAPVSRLDIATIALFKSTA